ncbi:hypothetical protein LLEC1_02991 [Akanthomyces lecanii]|uniref:Uncharacterized protein n=1 Tax=Cordyceps confragosa TaxID=2714763 RepID=A0A179I643_CORDF|nr:hypothetical protein LLEC1_02991 [Akanthomyces lecanii]
MPHRLPDPDSLVAGVPSTSLAFAMKMGSSQHAMSDVSQALEIARESPAGASDPTVGKILDHAIAHIWGKIQARPDDYVMTREDWRFLLLYYSTYFLQHYLTQRFDTWAPFARDKATTQEEEDSQDGHVVIGTGSTKPVQG